MTDDKNDHVTMLRLELGLLSQACARLKTHPALGRFHGLSSLGAEHADLMLHYVDQLDQLFATVTNHAATLERLAADHAGASEISHEVRRTMLDLDMTISPMIDAMRQHALTLRSEALVALGAGPTGTSAAITSETGAGDIGDRDSGAAPKGKLH